MIKRLWPLIFFCGCAVATVSTDDLDYSLVDIQKAINSTSGVGVEMDDGSDHEFNTKYFRLPIKEKPEPVRKDDRIRVSAHVVIVGDRRPYSVSVETTVEEKQNNGTWSEVSHDQRLARQMADQVQDYLAKHKAKNLIDDFRAF